MNLQLPKCQNIKKTIFTLFFMLLLSLASYSQSSKEVTFNNDWTFKGESLSGVQINENVTIPHSWNSQDAQKGLLYYRGTCEYTKSFKADAAWQGKRVFVRFEGVNITSKVMMNNKEVGSHRGGYAAFIFEITAYLNFDKDNLIQVEVSNEQTMDVIPLVGDFNNYGGIYRAVSLIIKNPICISPLDFASPGIYLKQQNVSEKNADVEVLTKISNATNEEAILTYESKVLDASGTIVKSNTSEIVVPVGNSDLSHKYTIPNPHLWNGKQDPYIYQVQVDIKQNGLLIDSKMEPLGLRYFSVDANKGFFLNGKHISLRGVCRHQDRFNKASALSNEDHEQDMDLMLEMGINTLRLAHYQHAEKIYDMADSSGLVVWAELPFVGIPGATVVFSDGFENTPEFKTNAKQQLHELIRQNFNHPSILMWSLFNEIQFPKDDSPLDFVKELNAIVKNDDPYRLSVGAHIVNPINYPETNEVTDIIAYNRYSGWYYGEPKDLGTFMDDVHQSHPDFKIGLSEYGAGGSIFQHTDKLATPNPIGVPHPEEYQSYYHEEHLKIIDERPYIWGTYLWNMFDFGSHFRREGDLAGMNDKGLVSYDRKTKKDAFYFYKANWSDQPVLHIASSRFIFRSSPKTEVRVYSNLSSVSLQVNGKTYPEKSPEKGVVVWENIGLELGANGIIVRAIKNDVNYTNDCVWMYEKDYVGMNFNIKVFDFLMVAWQWIIIGAIASILIWFYGVKRYKNSHKLKYYSVVFIFCVLTLSTLIMLFVKFYVPSLLDG